VEKLVREIKLPTSMTTLNIVNPNLIHLLLKLRLAMLRIGTIMFTSETSLPLSADINLGKNTEIMLTDKNANKLTLMKSFVLMRGTPGCNNLSNESKIKSNTELNRILKRFESCIIEPRIKLDIVIKTTRIYMDLAASLTIPLTIPVKSL
jgi:hypothetical protein